MSSGFIALPATGVGDGIVIVVQWSSVAINVHRHIIVFRAESLLNFFIRLVHVHVGGGPRVTKDNV